MEIDGQNPFRAQSYNDHFVIAATNFWVIQFMDCIGQCSGDHPASISRRGFHEWRVSNFFRWTRITIDYINYLSEDGKIILYDTRAPWGTSQTQSTLQLESEVTGLSFHPTMDHIFATSDHQGEVCLRDTRMAFGPLRQRHRVGKVRKVRSPSNSQNVDLSNMSRCKVRNPTVWEIST